MSLLCSVNSLTNNDEKAPKGTEYSYYLFFCS